MLLSVRAPTWLRWRPGTILGGRLGGHPHVGPPHGGPLLAAVVLAVGITATLLVVAGLRSNEHAAAERVMDQRAAVATNAVRVEAGRYLDLLRTVAAGIGVDDALTSADFEAATAPLADAGLRGATSVVFAVPVSPNVVGRTQQLWRDRGATGLVLTPRGHPPEHLFSVLSRPLQESALTGIDISASTEAAAALAEARRTGAPTVSDSYVLLRDRGLPASRQQLSFAFAAPVYGPAPSGGDRPAFRGWVVMGLHGGTFLEGVLPAASQGLLAVELYATHDRGEQVRVAAAAARGTVDLRRPTSVRVANRQWTLVAGADGDQLPGAHSGLPDTVLLGGAGFSAVLAWLVLVLATGRSRAQRQVLVATAELRAAEEESRRQAGLVGAVMDSLGDGVGVVDAAGRFLLTNPAGRRLLGDTDHVNGPDRWQELYGLFKPDGRTPFPTDELPVVRALRGEVADGVELVIRNRQRPEGILVSVDGRPLDPGAGQHGAVAVFRDITELRRYETDLTLFAGVVAHDLKAPLAIVRGHCENAADVLNGAPRTPAVDEAHAALGRITATVDRMADLIDTLLAYTTSRDAPLRLQTVPLTPLVAEVVAGRTGHRRPDDGPAPDIYVGPLPAVNADPAMLHHVVDNLIGNALKYVRPGHGARVDVTAAAALPGWIRVEIADRGIGIPDREKTDIFESFHRADAAAGYAGTGLGLAICRRIIERHDGTIGVADNPGGGTRFHFTLPLATAGAVEPPQVRLAGAGSAPRVGAAHDLPVPDDAVPAGTGSARG